MTTDELIEALKKYPGRKVVDSNGDEITSCDVDNSYPNEVVLEALEIFDDEEEDDDGD